MLFNLLKSTLCSEICIKKEAIYASKVKKSGVDVRQIELFTSTIC